jgi:hypothetical protein
MTASRKIFRNFLILAVLAIAWAPPFAQGSRNNSAPNNNAPPAAEGTPEERAACHPDVVKFCSELKPDAGSLAFLGCLQQHREKINQAILMQDSSYLDAGFARGDRVRLVRHIARQSIHANIPIHTAVTLRASGTTAAAITEGIRESIQSARPNKTKGDGVAEHGTDDSADLSGVVAINPRAE